MPPSIIVDAGGGYQVYWLLREMWIPDSESKLARVKGLLRRVQWALHAAAQAKGWSLDHDADLARLLRVPDTFHLKWPGGKVIQVIDFHRSSSQPLGQRLARHQFHHQKPDAS